MTGDLPVDTSESSFAAETAGCYSRYRRDYPPELITYLRELPRESRRLLDLGCGTGQFVRQLAPFFEQCIGVDPEVEMLDEAQRIAGERGVHNAEWIEAKAAELPGLGPLDLVTIGTAFHFMEPRATLIRLRELIREGGAIAVAYNGSPMWLHPDPWAKALRRVLEDWFGPLRDLNIAVEGIDAAERTMRELGYSDVERWERIYEEEIDADFVVGHIFSALSRGQVESGRRRLLAREILDALPRGHFVERVPVRAVSGRP